MVVNDAFKAVFLDDTTKYIICKGSAGSGKSYAITQKLITRCLQYKRRVLVMRAFQVDLKASCIQLFLDICDKDDIPYKYNKGDFTMQIGESIIQFKGGDNPGRLKSIAGITDVFIEECTEASPDLFDMLNTRLRTITAPDEPVLQFHLAFNPVEKANWVYRYFWNDDKDNNEYFFCNETSFTLHESTYKDNYYNLPKSYIDTLENFKYTNPYYYQVYACNAWGVIGKRVFPYGSYEVAHLDIPFRSQELTGLDPGYTDATAFNRIYFFKDATDTPTLYIQREYHRECASIQEIYDGVKDMIQRSTCYTDCAAAIYIEELQKKGIYAIQPCTKGPNSVIDGIDKMKQYRIVIDPSCTYTIQDFETYTYEQDKRTGLYLNHPARYNGSKHQNHVDSCRYAIEGLGQQLATVKIKGL